jgi:TPR repeat protein
MKQRTQYLSLLLSLGLSACASQPGNNTMMQAQQSFKQQNYSASFQSMMPLASKGDAKAQYIVGYQYYYGLGIGKDEQMAMYWFRKAAQQNQKQAIQALSMIDTEKARQNKKGSDLGVHKTK